MSYGQGFTCEGELIYTYGIEIFLTQHCNLSCKGCSASSPFAAAGFAALDDFMISLQKLKPVLRPDRITFLGGEPLLHPEIDEFIKFAKDSGMFNKIMLTTNGLLLKKASKLLWDLVDGIEISLYPANYKVVFENAQYYLDMAKNYKTELIFYPKDNFNHIIFSSPLPGDLVEKVFSNCYYKNYTHSLHKRRIYRCAPSVFSHHYLSHFAENTDCSDNSDYLEIQKSSNIKEDLVNFFGNTSHLNACRFCAGSSGSIFQNEQLRKNEVPQNDFNITKLLLNV